LHLPKTIPDNFGQKLRRNQNFFGIPIGNPDVSNEKFSDIIFGIIFGIGKFVIFHQNFRNVPIFWGVGNCFDNKSTAYIPEISFIVNDISIDSSG
jgi:hypothetical protein